MGLLPGLGGCTSLLNDDSSVELLQVEILNLTDQAVTVHTRVHYDEEVVEEVTYELEPDDEGRVLDCTWPSEPGDFALSARLEDDDEWEKRELKDYDSDCAAAYVHVGLPSDLDSLSIAVRAGCDSHADRC